MRKVIVLILMAWWALGGCQVHDAAYKARLKRLLEISKLRDKGVEHYNSKELYDKEIEQLDRRYERLEDRWQTYANEPTKDKF